MFRTPCLPSIQLRTSAYDGSGPALPVQPLSGGHFPVIGMMQCHPAFQ